MIADGQKRIEKYSKQGALHFYSYGVSMGTLFANKFSRDTAEISHVILNLTYGDVAKSIWTYRGVNKTKTNLLDRGVDEETLRRGITYCDPIVNAAGLAGKKVMLQLSKNDKVLTYDQAVRTKQAFEAANLDMAYTENKYLGHYLSAVRNMLSVKDIDSFFSSR